MLVDVEVLVGGREHFGLVDVIDADGFQNLRLGKMADAAFRHDGNGNGLHDLLDQLWRAHTRHAASLTNVGRHALERHDRDRA